MATSFVPNPEREMSPSRWCRMFPALHDAQPAREPTSCGRLRGRTFVAEEPALPLLATVGGTPPSRHDAARACSHGRGGALVSDCFSAHPTSDLFVFRARTSRDYSYRAHMSVDRVFAGLYDPATPVLTDP